jgi:hypothetical protein
MSLHDRLDRFEAHVDARFAALDRHFDDIHWRRSSRSTSP